MVTKMSNVEISDLLRDDSKNPVSPSGVKWNRDLAETIDPLDFYKKHYTGLSRGRLQKEDFGLYMKLWRDGLLNNVPVLRAEQRAEQRDFGDDPVTYYKEHYAGLTRGKLQKEDRSLYNRLWRDGLLDKVFVSSKFGDNPVAYYQEHYPGLTRGKLPHIASGLYRRLSKDGLLDQIPILSSKYGKDPVAYYKKHHAGLSRGKLREIDPSLYRRLSRNGLLDNVPVLRALQRDFGEDPIAYYQKHYAGLTIEQLRKEDSSLYARLRRDGLLDNIPA